MPEGGLVVRVASRRPVSSSVEEFVLERVDGGELPAWAPGAHISVVVGDGSERQYSLCGDPADLTHYRIGVLLEQNGRGGSEWMHRDVVAGTELHIGAPLNHFGLEPAEAYHLIAGGVGITPIIAMAEHLEATGAPWRMTYLGRSRSTMAYLDRLDVHGDKVTVRPDDEFGFPDVPALVAGAPGEAIYACGPEPLLVALEAATAEVGATLQVERFAPKDRSQEGDVDTEFEVELAQSGLVLTVPVGESILSVVEKAGIFVASSCREGTCGTCETQIVAGEADHRDSLLSPEEQAANDCMMVCVSRSKTPRLTLEL